MTGQTTTRKHHKRIPSHTFITYSSHHSSKYQNNDQRTNNNNQYKNAKTIMPINPTRSAERDFNRHYTTNYILTRCSPDKKTTNNQRPKTSHAETNNNTQTSQTHSVAHIHHIFVPPQFKVPKQRPKNIQTTISTNKKKNSM